MSLRRPIVLLIALTGIAVLVWKYGNFNPSSSPAEHLIRHIAYSPPTTLPSVYSGLLTDDTSTAFPRIFEAAFTPGTIVTTTTDSAWFLCDTVGKLLIESGKLVAGDPGKVDNLLPFAQDFPRGSFPVEYVLLIDSGWVPAFCRIRFSDKPVRHWEKARLPGDEVYAVEQRFSGSTFSTGEDCAMLADLSIKALYDKAFASDPGHRWQKYIQNALQSDNPVNGRYAMGNIGSHNFALFETGTAAGHYLGYVGYDDQSHPCRLLIDFSRLNWWAKGSQLGRATALRH